MLKSLLVYNRHFNQAYIKHMEAQKVLDERSISLLSHIINAQHIWNARMKGEDLPMKPWEVHELEDMERLNEVAYMESMRLMKAMSPVQEIDYSNTRGESYTNSLQDVMLHITNHGTYHRGQLAARLKEIGVDAIPSDYIKYKREQ